jgi:hypothetical protein
LAVRAKHLNNVDTRSGQDPGEAFGPVRWFV